MTGESIFYEYVKNNLSKVVAKVIKKLNGKEQDALTYLYKSMLRSTYCVAGIWQSLTVYNTRVSADFVAMDSTLPLKKRERISKASGEIVKSGMEMNMTEKQMDDLTTMIRSKVENADIIKALFEDTKKCIEGIYELMERCFLEGLSTGVCCIDDQQNAGIGVRMDFGYLDSHKFTPQVKWSDFQNSKPLEDFRKIIKAARHEGHSVNYVLMDENTFDNLARSESIRQYFAWSMNFFGNNANIPQPTLEQLNQALKRDSRYKFEIEIIDRTVITEHNGKQEPIRPWAEGMVVLLESKNVGILAWSRVAEMDYPASGVTYSTAEQAILVSKFRKDDPTLMEVTRSQARMVPVITNTETIWQLDTKEASADETEGDDNVDLWGTPYGKTAVISALGAIGIDVADTITEKEISVLVNDLSKAKQNELKKILTA